MRRGLLVSCLLAVASTASAEPAPFAPVEPYFPTGPAAQGARDFALERWQAARDEFAAAAASASPDDKARLGFMLGLCDRHLGRYAEAAAAMDAAAVALPLLTDYARYEAADDYFHLSKFEVSAERAAAVTADSVLAAEAQLQIGDALRAQERWKDVAALYAAYLAAHPTGGIRLAEARFWLADAQEKLHRSADATANYRRLTVEAPLSPWAPRAQARLDDLYKPLPKKKREATQALTSAELTTRGLVYFEAMRNEPAEADLSAALKDPKLPPEQRCIVAYNLAQTIFKERQRPRAAPAFDVAVEACAKTKNVDLQVRSAYQGARSWGSANETKRAIALFERAETWHPEHSFADDSRLRQSEEWEILERNGEPGAGDQVNAILASIPTKYPDGDMKGEALWRLAWRSWKKGDWQGTIDWLDKERAAVGHEDNYFAQGQTFYWQARALDKLGRAAEARAAYAQGVREYPLSYYALLGLNRLRESAPSDFAALTAELAKPPANAPATAFDFKPRELYSQPAYLRGVELLRLGLGESAERELARAGLRPPEGRKEVTDPDAAELLWATALLYDRAGRYDKSHWIARWNVRDHERAWPNPGNRAKWDIAYPRAFWNLIEAAANKEGYPGDLLMAFVREESAFDPLMESFANAIGLTQMILPTATRFGKGLGFEINRDSLRDPGKNVAVGSKWLAFLWSTYRQNPHLVVSGYNAGEGSVWHWLCQRGDLNLDEFEEEIPYDETRNYTKRVLSSYFAYAYLSNQTIPVVPNVVPPGAKNEKRCH